jgi:hypothetical protein
VAAVHRGVAQPARQVAGDELDRLGPAVELGGELEHLRPHRVGVALGDPLVGDREGVGGERGAVPAPHRDRRVVLPPVAGQRHRPQHLQRLDALLAQSGLVEHLRALGEVRVREERLHPCQGRRGA